MRTYLMVLAKIRRPSMTPSARTPRSLSSSTTSAASLATSVALSTEMPMSAACSARASLTPSPMNPTAPPLSRSSRMIRAFCSGRHAGEDARLPCGGGQLRIGHGLHGGAAERPAGEHAEFVTDLFGDPGVVAGGDLDRDAERLELVKGGPCIGFGPVQEDEEPGKDQILLVGAASGPPGRRRAGFRQPPPGIRRRTACPASPARPPACPRRGPGHLPASPL